MSGVQKNMCSGSGPGNETNFALLHTQSGRTAVCSASVEGHSEVVKLLVQAGVDLELQREVY